MLSTAGLGLVDNGMTYRLLLASVLSFLLAELLDLAVYLPLRKKGLWLAVMGSGAAGAAVDSALFLLLAFGSMDFWAGNTLGKAWASLAAGAALWTLRERRQG